MAASPPKVVSETTPTAAPSPIRAEVSTTPDPGVQRMMDAHGNRFDPKVLPKILEKGAILAIAFVLVHVLLNLYLKIGPGAYIPVDGFRLLEIFVEWAPILFLAALLGFGLHRPIPARMRFLVLGLYVLALILLVVPLFFAPPATAGNDCRAHPDRLDCVASPLFSLLVAFAPIPAAIFLFANGRYQWSISRCIGVALMFSMLWRNIDLSFPDLLRIAAGGGVLPATPTFDFYVDFFVKVLWDLTYPVLGLLFFFHQVPWIHVRPHWGDNLKGVLVPLGSWIRRSPGADLAWGFTFFALNIVLLQLLSLLLANSPTQSVGDDSNVFKLLTLDQVFLLAIVAGVGEELVFRGILQSGLHRLLPDVHFPKLGHGLAGAGALVLLASLGASSLRLVDAPVGVGFMTLGIALIGAAFLFYQTRTAVAILVTAVGFAIVHSGYLDLDHLIQPFLFALLVGGVYRLFGLLPAILIHTQIDIVAFSYQYAGSHPGGDGEAMMWFAFVLIVLNIIIGLVWCILQLVESFDRRKKQRRRLMLAEMART